MIGSKKAMCMALAFCCLSGTTFAQNYNMYLSNVTVKQAMDELKNETGYSFIYSSGDVNTSKKVSVNADNSSVKDIVGQILDGQRVSYEIQGNNIIVRSISASISQQTKTVKGTVVDSKGEPIIGANVLVKGTTVGSITDLDGKFTLEAAEGQILVISYIGYTNYEVKVSNKSTLHITLKEDSKALDEVVVVGYGVQKKQTMTAAASSVKVSSLESLPSTNLASTLGGRVSGVLIQQGSGEAGYENPHIIIRGSSSPTSSEPLIVVDGIIGRSMSQLDPNEIENMTVLKDASAVAPYGARGANGVILITTKRGKAGKTNINYNFKGGFGEPTRLPEIASSYDHARLMNVAWRNKEIDEGNDPGMFGKYSEEELQKFKDGSDPYGHPNTNWLKEVLLPRAWQQQHSLSASGGSDHIQYFVGLGYVNQSALYGDVRTKTPSANFKRYNFRTNIDASLNKYVKLSADVAYRQEDRNTIPESTWFIFHNMYRNPQTDGGRFPDGKLGKVSLGQNPIGLVTDGGWKQYRKSILNSRFVLNLDVPYVEGLNVKGIFSFDKTFNKSKQWITPVNFYVWNKVTGQYDSSSPNREGSDLTESFDHQQAYTFETQVNYNKVLNSDHHLGALFVFSMSEGYDNEFWASRYKYKFSSINQLFAGPDKDKDNGGSASESGKLGTVLRFTYNYKEKYMVELNGRLDGSEKFPKSKRFGFFPSASVAWRISTEPFMERFQNFVDNLKLRASWGKAGTDNIARFQYQSAYGLGDNSVFGGGSPEIAMGYTETRFANPNITWETSEMFNVGLDGTLFKNKLSFELDYFYKKTTDILRRRTDMPGILGYELPAANVGIVDNRGIDLNISHNNHINDFHYSISGNVTWARNKVIDLLEPDGQKNNPRIRKTGHPMDQMFGYEALGLFQSDEEANNWPQPQFGRAKAGDIKYKDQNNDGKIDGEDRVAIGRSPFPELIFGLNMGCEYKGFDLQLFFQGAGLTDFYYSGYLAQPYREGAGGTLFKHHINNFWSPENPNAEFPRLYYGSNANNAETSSFWVRDGSYIRLKNVEIGYNFKTSLLRRFTALKALRLYLSGQNLFTCSAIKYFDPESRDASGRSYPQMRNYVLGVNVTF